MKHTQYRPVIYPFTAIVGQELLKLGLVLNAVNPWLCGILIKGDKGTAKSTAARALASLLPEIDVVENCPFNCDPSDVHLLCADCRAKLEKGKPLNTKKTPVKVVDLPLNTTEDRLVGSIDFEYALRTGTKRFQPGLLAEANRGIIYIDEVNLLEDHLVDILLDSAVTGINIVQRESINFIHPSRFILCATMNPEEGDIRPQLLDRFGFTATITGLSEPKDRVEIIRRRECFDNDPDEFLRQYLKEQDSLQKSIMQARQLLENVSITDTQISQISQICLDYNVAGHRADIIIEKAARTISAMEGRLNVASGDIEKAAQLVLPHRATSLKELEKGADNTDQKTENEKKQPKDSSKENSLDGVPDSEMNETEPGEEQASDAGPSSERMKPKETAAKQDVPQSEAMGEKGDAHEGVMSEQIFEIGDITRIPSQDMRFARDNLKHRTGRRRATTKTSNKTGRYVRSTSQRLNNDLAFDATLRAAAPYQKTRPRNDLAVAIHEDDIREKIRQKKISNLLLFVVDASGSMGTKLMTETKGTILALLIEAYQKRDKVGMVAFKAQEAEILLPPTNSVELAKKLLEELPTGGKTPLGSGLLTAYQMIKLELRRDSKIVPLMVIITDGRANVGLYSERSYEGPMFGEIYREINEICDLFRKDQRIRTMVIDVEEKGLGSFNRAKKLAKGMNSKYYALENIISQNIMEAVKQDMV